MMTTAEYWLTHILGCGIADISILGGVEYDLDRVLKTVKNYGGDLSLGSVMAAVFDVGRTDIQEAIDNRLVALEDEMTEAECHENEEYRALLELDPFDDIREYHNYLDTRVWIEQHEDEYKKYLAEACDEFEQYTGFSLFD